MEKLEVKNFLSIRSADINLSRINIFIGPQAQGKSILSKLIYFFKGTVEEAFDAITEDKTRSGFNSLLVSKFESIFPKYAWEKHEFSVKYSNKYYWIRLSHKKDSASRFKISVDYSESLKKSYDSARRFFKKNITQETEVSAARTRLKIYRDLRDYLSDCLFADSEDKTIEQPLYIPAGRSFFANLQKNVFSFISSSIPIDYFLKEFGAIYERSRERHIIDASIANRPKSLEKIIHELICGRYFSEKGQDWIVNDYGRVNVSNSSSGQQESLPLALVLSTWPYLEARQISRHFVIEEPEAHLFPVAQGQVASLIACAYNAGAYRNSFVITTHSPYILTAFNNLIQAGNVEQTIEDKSELYKLVPEEQTVWFGDVSAYSVNNGVVQSILNNDLCLIDANVIDEISNHFSERFESLVIMEAESVMEDEV